MLLETFVFADTVKAEGIRLISSLVVLLITWAGGYLLLARWELEKKSREMDLTIAIQFQQLFGEFKEIWRLWKVYTPAKAEGGSPAAPAPSTVPGPSTTVAWDLLVRASSAEGRVEAVLLKLATDRKLEATQLKTLGLFRQSFQVLRQGIRDEQSLDYGYKDARYRLFNRLGAQVAHIIVASATGGRPTEEDACEAFQAILDVRSEHLREEEGNMPDYVPKIPLPAPPKGGTAQPLPLPAAAEPELGQ